MSRPFSADWLAAQRWFRAKQRRIATVEEVDRARIGVSRLRVLEVAYADHGDPDRYLGLAVDDREPADGEGAWAALVGAMAQGVELPTEAGGRFVAGRTTALDDLLPSSRETAEVLSERRLSVEQSNTSVVLGDRLVLKLFRRLEPGENPELEIGVFLTLVGFADTPALAGWLTYEAPDRVPAAGAMLQELVATRGDAWSVMLDALAAAPWEGIRQAGRIGEVTAGLHAALAARPEDPAFPARAATNVETAAWRASAEAQLAQALGAVSGAEHERLVAVAPQVRARFADAFGSATGDARISRIHGDYHLGQLLARTDGGYSVIDFEGEPARPLDERRLPSSPLRDVAGMLRSLDYAARTAEAGDHAPGFEAGRWVTAARRAFLEAYGGVGDDERGLLDAFELEKACYEIRYEASNRPDWLWLPLAAVERLASPR